MADPISFDPYLGWVDVSDPNNIPDDARTIGADDLLRYENFGVAAAARINELADVPTRDELTATYVGAVDQAGDTIPGKRARIVFDANGDVDNIILEDI